VSGEGGIAPVTAAEGPAFPPFVKLLLTALTLAVFGAGALALDQATLRNASTGAKLLVAGGLIVLVVTNYWVLKSRIRIDAREIVQTWIWTKRVRWADVVQAKLIYLPWLAWLVAPRMVVRGGAGVVTLFNAADPRVLAVFTRYALAPELRDRS